MRKAVDRATKLTSQLLAFSRKEILEPEIVDLSAIVADLEKSLPSLIGEDVTLSVTLTDRPCRANVDPGLLQQAIMNMVINARDAMPGGGTLTLDTSVMEVEAAFLRPDSTAGPVRCAVLTVCDTGAGMDDATRERIFDPFFTTKRVGEGTGLGLSMVYGFAQQSGGRVDCESQAGEGARFRMYFPRVNRAASKRKDTEAVEMTDGGSETILVVEDEDSVRKTTVESLTEAGYQILAEPDAARALSAAEKHDGIIDLLLTDVVMPGMSGVDLAERIQAARPGIRVLFMSGYAPRELSRRGADSPKMTSLAKPFAHEGLLRRVREVLDSTKQAQQAGE